MANQKNMLRTAWVTAFGLLFFAVFGLFSTLQAAALSDAEKQDLVFIREEEKHARDAYLTLYDIWAIRIFSNISSSEQTHMDAIKGLLDKYGIPDPAAGKGIGEFTDQRLKDLYTDLMSLGTGSLIGAMEVGIIIEEKDIEDIQEALGRTTHRNISRVYMNLLNGSYNYLESFTYQLTKLGITLEP